MNEAKRVSDMTDQEVIAELRKWEAEFPACAGMNRLSFSVSPLRG